MLNIEQNVIVRRHRPVIGRNEFLHGVDRGTQGCHCRDDLMSVAAGSLELTSSLLGLSASQSGSACTLRPRTVADRPERTFARASVTLFWEATAPVKLPAWHGPRAVPGLGRRDGGSILSALPAGARFAASCLSSTRRACGQCQASKGSRVFPSLNASSRIMIPFETAPNSSCRSELDKLALHGAFTGAWVHRSSPNGSP